MRNNTKYIWGIVVLLVVAFGLLSWSWWSDPYREVKKNWADNGISCLASHQNAALHFHPFLKILIDDVEETIPADVGIVRGCMAEIHTHDDTGKIHVETISAGKEVRLKQFFVVWGKELERPGYSLEMTVDGQPNNELGELILKDEQKIVLNYSIKK